MAGDRCSNSDSHRVRAAMVDRGVDAVLLSVGADLPWLCGYEAMPLERLTMLVVPRDGDATLVVPRLEAPRVTERPEVFSLRTWDETDDPIGVVAVAGRLGSDPGGRRPDVGPLPGRADRSTAARCAASVGPTR